MPSTASRPTRWAIFWQCRSGCPKNISVLMEYYINHFLFEINTTLWEIQSLVLNGHILSNFVFIFKYPCTFVESTHSSKSCCFFIPQLGSSIRLCGLTSIHFGDVINYKQLVLTFHKMTFLHFQDIDTEIPQTIIKWVCINELL